MVRRERRRRSRAFPGRLRGGEATQGFRRWVLGRGHPLRRNHGRLSVSLEQVPRHPLTCPLAQSGPGGFWSRDFPSLPTCHGQITAPSVAALPLGLGVLRWEKPGLPGWWNQKDPSGATGRRGVGVRETATRGQGAWAAGEEEAARDLLSPESPPRTRPHPCRDLSQGRPVSALRPLEP